MTVWPPPARWFWWRCTAEAELASLVASLVFGTFLIAELKDTDDYSYFGHRLIINTVLTTVVWIGVAFGKTLHLPCVSTVFVAKTLPLPCGPQRPPRLGRHNTSSTSRSGCG